MNLKELQLLLQETQQLESIKLLLPDGAAIPAHFHLTEIGKVSKDFVDCGGTRRQKVNCVLQTWVANDTDHRLSLDKLNAILAKSTELGLEPDAEIEFEVQQSTLSMFSLAAASVEDGSLRLELASTQTACLAPDRCGIPSLQVLGDDCSGPGCC